MDDLQGSFMQRIGSFQTVSALEKAWREFHDKVQNQAFRAEMKHWNSECAPELRHCANLIRHFADALDKIAEEMSNAKSK